jgi:hypothetical protein
MVQAVVSRRFPNKVIIHLQGDELIIHTTTNMVALLDIKMQYIWILFNYLHELTQIARMALTM